MSFKASISLSSSRKGSRHHIISGRRSSVGVLCITKTIENVTHVYQCHIAIVGRFDKLGGFVKLKYSPSKGVARKLESLTALLVYPDHFKASVIFN